MIPATKDKNGTERSLSLDECLDKRREIKLRALDYFRKHGNQHVESWDTNDVTHWSNREWFKLTGRPSDASAMQRWCLKAGVVWRDIDKGVDNPTRLRVRTNDELRNTLFPELAPRPVPVSPDGQPIRVPGPSAPPLD